MQLLTAKPGGAPAPKLDYDLHTEGEALLGWLNGASRLQAAAPFDGNRLLREMAERIRGRLSGESIEIARLKMTLRSDAGAGHGDAEHGGRRQARWRISRNWNISVPHSPSRRIDSRR